MAKVAREAGVPFRGRVDALGALTFAIAPIVSHAPEADDDLDLRIAGFAKR